MWGEKSVVLSVAGETHVGGQLRVERQRNRGRGLYGEGLNVEGACLFLLKACPLPSGA